MDHDLLHGQYMQTGINLMASDSSLIRVSATKSTLNFHMINLAPLSQGWLCGALVSSVLCSKAIAIYSVLQYDMDPDRQFRPMQASSSDI